MVNWQATPYLIPLLAATLASIYISAVAWRRRGKAPGAVTVTGLMHANAIWAFMYALELSTPRLAWQLWLARLQYLGILPLPALWLVFCLHYTRRLDWLIPRRQWLFVLLPTAFYLLVLTNDLHGLIWPQVSQERLGAALILQVTHGLGFWTIILYSYAFMAAGTLLLIQAWLEASPLYRRQVEIVLAGALAPWVGNALYVTRLSPFPALDLTPFAFTLTGLLATWGLARYNLLDLTPLARNQVVEFVNEAIIVFDPQGRILDSNPAARALLSWIDPQPDPPAAAQALKIPPLGRRLRRMAELDRAAPLDRLTGSPLAQALAAWPELLTCCIAQQTTSRDLTMRRGDQERCFEAQVLPIQARSGQTGARLIVLREITERKQVELALRQARDLAEETSRAKSAFLATMSHELRTPLTIIIGYAEMLHEEAAEQGQDHTALRLERVGTAARHLLGLVNDILDLSKIEAGRLALSCWSFPVQALLEETLDVGRPLFEQNQNQLLTEFAPGLGEMYSDSIRVRQVLLNLLSNAAKFTHQGQITLRAYRQMDWITFEVSDTGIGIPPESIGQLFQNFSQLDPSSTRRYGGAGLGLAISKRLCEIMGGEIGVESQPGVGSTFWVRLPASIQPCSPGE